MTPPARPVTWPFPATLPPSNHPPLHAAIDAATAALIGLDRLRNALTAAGIAPECAVHLARSTVRMRAAVARLVTLQDALE